MSNQGEFDFKLPELDRERTKADIEGIFDRFRFYHSITFEEREAVITAGYSDMRRSEGTTSDQTASIAAYNIDEPAKRRHFCETVERAIRKLPAREKLLITERYLKEDAVFDWVVYTQIFDPPISKDTYSKIRWKAFYRLAFILDELRLLQIHSLVKGS